MSEKGHMVLSDIEKEFGPINIKHQTKVFKQFINKQINQLEKALTKVKSKSDYEMLENRIAILKEVLS